MIRASEVRLVAEDGEQLGIQVLKRRYGGIAANAGLDLVEVAPTAKPPVCRLMDYGKYKYLMSKKATEAKKKQTVIHVKEIKLRSKTEEHDLKFKLKNIIKFLTAGDKVKVTMVFRGREITHTELGLERLKAYNGRGQRGRNGRADTEARRAFHEYGNRAAGEERVIAKYCTRRAGLKER